MIDLSKHKTLCQPKQKIIISEENKCKHIANNIDSSEVRHFKVDGDVISGVDEQRCDYLLLNDKKKTAYYIELKGSDIEKAIEQIKNSEKIISGSIKDYISFYRIIYKTATHSVNSNKVIKWKQKCGRAFSNEKPIAMVIHREFKEDI